MAVLAWFGPMVTLLTRAFRARTSQGFLHKIWPLRHRHRPSWLRYYGRGLAYPCLCYSATVFIVFDWRNEVIEQKHISLQDIFSHCVSTVSSALKCFSHRFSIINQHPAIWIRSRKTCATALTTYASKSYSTALVLPCTVRVLTPMICSKSFSTSYRKAANVFSTPAWMREQLPSGAQSQSILLPPLK